MIKCKWIPNSVNWWGEAQLQWVEECIRNESEIDSEMEHGGLLWACVVKDWK
jgi:hypothetical protein